MAHISVGNRRLALAATLMGAMTFAAGTVHSQKAFSGDDAAHVDWAWKNCGVEATAKERGLVETTAKATGDRFQKTYEQGYNAVIAKTAAPADLRRMCETIKGWYGTSGSRIDGLVTVKGTAPEVIGKSIGQPATSLEKAVELVDVVQGAAGVRCLFSA